MGPEPIQGADDDGRLSNSTAAITASKPAINKMASEWSQATWCSRSRCNSCDASGMSTKVRRSSGFRLALYQQDIVLPVIAGAPGNR